MIEDLAPGIGNAQGLRTEKTGKIEKDHAQETEKDQGLVIGIDVGKTKDLGQEIEAIETESQGQNLKVVTAVLLKGSMEREPSGLKMNRLTRKKNRKDWRWRCRRGEKE